MGTSYCNPMAKKCERKVTCNHHIVKPLLGERKEEDLSDICLPHYRLYIEGDKCLRFNDKAYYVKLLNFYDHTCCEQRCEYQEIHVNNMPRSGNVKCKLGEEFICKHPSHPTNAFVNIALKIFKAMDEASQKADVDEGTMTYICPLCGNEAIVNSDDCGGCKECGMFIHINR